MEAAEIAEAGIVTKPMLFGVFDFEKIPIAPEKKVGGLRDLLIILL